jgi:alkyl hydroperoxide reductase subunit AhpC
MGVRINDIVSNFTTETDQGSIQFHDWIGDQWAILFATPRILPLAE